MVMAVDAPHPTFVLAPEVFGVVLTDMKVPWLDGEQICEDVIRRKVSSPPVVSMTYDLVNPRTRSFLDGIGPRCAEQSFAVQSLGACIRDDEDDAPPPPSPPALILLRSRPPGGRPR